MKTSQRDVDVVVVGSGAAGLTAALAASEGNADVALLEKADTIGGATAVSGGVIWAPNNHHMAAAGLNDSRSDAVAYITRLSDDRSRPAVIEAFVDQAPEAISFVESASTLRFQLLEHYADYYAEHAGGAAGGRSLDPGLFDTRNLGDWQDRLRRSPVFEGFALSIAEFFEWQAGINPLALPFDVIGKRAAEGIVGYGASLVGHLLHAVLERKVEPTLNAAARDLLLEGDQVVGVRAVVDGVEVDYRARRGVILASGGFEWNPQIRRRYLGGVLTHPLGPPSNEGDGVDMLSRAGAALGNMSEAWWCPAVAIPDESYDGAPLYRGEFTMRALPHSLIVNARGQRFVNEAHNYNDFMKAAFAFDPSTYDRSHLPAWLVLDGTYTEKYPVLTTMPGMPLPDWIPQAASLDALAEQVGIDAAGLDETVTRFNQFAAAGHDEDFGRGSYLYDRIYGDPRHAPNANLGPLLKPPFAALQLHPGALGTKGGAEVDAQSRVLRPNGEPIAGLYAAGNVMAGFSGAGYPGAGATIAGALTFGYIAGRHAATR